ncbi:universal stress protein [Muricauda sp. SCSIO 64092]|uniref:universal stress protein n=1 Tax=Allomuricauda sp. SCSIO 64092 TaxID=2908842 RepID=UPI001FF52BF7|nr:universal stress protein [Muricauda sp. SCSIO 64092]UOY08271.1 universal stress protein [Muricauda sp. SCSIO 64092]
MKVLVPFDFSEESTNALRLGKELAGKLGVDLKVFHSLGMPNFLYSVSEKMDSLKESLLTVAELELNKVLNELFDNPKNIEVEICEGSTSSRILKNTYDKDVFLTILGRKDQVIPNKVGSTTRDVIRYANGSVISIKEKLAVKSIKNILVVTDFSSTPINAMYAVKKIQKINNAQLKLLNVNTMEDWSSTKEVIVKMKEFCKIHSLTNVDLQVINDNTFEQGVLNELKANSYNLMAIRIVRPESNINLPEERVGIERLMDNTNVPIMTYAHHSPY